MNQPIEADVKAAYEEACDAGKRVVRALFPDAFKEKKFKPGNIVFSKNFPEELRTVIGYADDPAAMAFYKSIGGMDMKSSPEVILGMTEHGSPKRVDDDQYWELYKRPAKGENS